MPPAFWPLRSTVPDVSVVVRHAKASDAYYLLGRAAAVHHTLHLYMYVRLELLTTRTSAFHPKQSRQLYDA